MVVSAATVVESVVDSVLEPPPQATNANAKPHTNNNAITFFIVFRFYRFLKFDRKDSSLGRFKGMDGKNIKTWPL